MSLALQLLTHCRQGLNMLHDAGGGALKDTWKHARGGGISALNCGEISHTAKNSTSRDRSFKLLFF